MPNNKILKLTQSNTKRLTLSGPDASDLLHRITTLNFKNLSITESSASLGFFLNPVGRILAPFYVWRTGHPTSNGPDQWSFEVEIGAIAAFKDTLDRMTFAENITISDTPKQTPHWLFSPKKLLNTGLILMPKPLIIEGVSYFWYTYNSEIFAQENSFLSLQDTQILSEPQWRKIRVSNLMPELGSEIFLTESNPLELGLGYGIAENKGCYPGQEVIEKMISIGSVSKKLGLLKFDLDIEKNAMIYSVQDDTEVGKILSISKPYALAMIRKTHLKKGTPFRSGQSNLLLEETV